jgi:membrane-associated HD superfamily phosphohydrolase
LPIPAIVRNGDRHVADSSEAALRSLKEASQNKPLDMIKKIFQCTMAASNN